MTVNKKRAKMPHGKACICDSPRSARMVYWKIKKYWYKGYKKPGEPNYESEYSIINCGICGRVWRTKAKYVDELI